jgi:hypothetical protein
VVIVTLNIRAEANFGVQMNSVPFC